jgi:hypothetical protein
LPVPPFSWGSGPPSSKQFAICSLSSWNQTVFALRETVREAALKQHQRGFGVAQAAVLPERKKSGSNPRFSLYPPLAKRLSPESLGGGFSLASNGRDSEKPGEAEAPPPHKKNKARRGQRSPEEMGSVRAKLRGRFWVLARARSRGLVDFAIPQATNKTVVPGEPCGARRGPRSIRHGGLAEKALV